LRRAADKALVLTTTNRRVRHLRQLALEGRYPVQPALVAEAIVARQTLRRLVPETSFRNDAQPAQVRSFRPSRQARSFRPCNPSRPRRGLHAAH
jgi:hypothetical protein